tara:strand:+ start:306 stop:914 length:609 start_codon:yes stop_codon:yes gene_type:complete
MKAIDLFSDWALNDRDLGMEKNHMASVKKMLSLIFHKRAEIFSFVDLGCGNGYVVREVSKHPLCQRSIGVDGAVEMIKKAKLIDSKGEYICSNISSWLPEKKVDFIHSMEVMYYLENPQKIITNINQKCLKKNGMMIMGIDFYQENSDCHSWPNDLNLPMKLLSIREWIIILENSGLSDIKFSQENGKGNFPGTLILSGINS